MDEAVIAHYSLIRFGDFIPKPLPGGFIPRTPDFASQLQIETL